MSTAVKWVIGIIIVAALGWLLWWSGWLGHSSAPAASAPSTQQANTQTTVAQPTNGMSAPTDTSDAALSQDTAAVDAQMQGLSSDSANVNSSLNDQPGTVTY